MNYLLDTCVISELIKPEPYQALVHWINRIDEENLFLSVITIGEIERGIHKLVESKRKTKIHVFLHSDLLQRFNNRILDLNTAMLLRWGEITSRLEKSGKKIPIMDSLIAVTTIHYDLILVTRNVKDFINLDLQIMNPWDLGEDS